MITIEPQLERIAVHYFYQVALVGRKSICPPYGATALVILNYLKRVVWISRTLRLLSKYSAEVWWSSYKKIFTTAFYRTEGLQEIFLEQHKYIVVRMY